MSEHPQPALPGFVPQPLKGKRVVDLSRFIAGPTAAQYLADFGAEVVKIESAQGDGTRALPGNQFGSYYTRSFNTGKDSRVLDLRRDTEREELHTMLADADAFICNMAPEALRGYGLDGPSLRKRYPQLVITLISGYGQHDARSCMDTIAQCESGFALLNGDEDGSPRVSTSWPIDIFSGLYAGMSTAMAMLDPHHQGCFIDLTMMEVAATALLGPAALAVSEGDTLAPPMGNRDRSTAPSSVYRCADGFVYIMGGLDGYWNKLRPLINGQEASAGDRLARAVEFDAQVEAWTIDRTCADVLAQMQKLQIPAGKVRDPGDAVAMIRSLRPGAVSQAMPSGEHIPVYPALFDGQRLERSAAPDVGGPRRPLARS